jgi:hypothetical protein
MQRWPTADIDLFVYGLDEAEAQAKLVAILTRIQRTIIKRFGVGNDVYFIKTPNTVTVGCGLIGRSIQVILRLCTRLQFESGHPSPRQFSCLTPRSRLSRWEQERHSQWIRHRLLLLRL